MLISLFLLLLSEHINQSAKKNRTNDDSNSSVSNARKEKTMMCICGNKGEKKAQTRKNRNDVTVFLL
jgi:hypothetical protein